MKNIFSLFFITILILPLQSCKNNYHKDGEKMKNSNDETEKLKKLFKNTKTLCFGRYVVTVPSEANLIVGDAALEVIIGGLNARTRKIKEEIEKIKWTDETADFTYNDKGPIEGSWQFRYYEDELSKKYKLHFFRTFVTKDDFTFIMGDSVRNGESQSATEARQFIKANGIRIRQPEEIPQDPGLCVEHGFLAKNNYAEQEIDDVGLYLPSFPDITFSISSNKDAYGDYSPADFETEMRKELSLLNRIQGAKDIQGSSYPKRTLLREGKRAVQHWKGEESLIRRADGAHDFEWALVGKPRDIANPSVLEVKMYTKVAHNMVGAAEAASLTDDEAIDLWDKLLSSLKFRVKVPGAPPGSYYIDPEKSEPPPAR